MTDIIEFIEKIRENLNANIEPNTISASTVAGNTDEVRLGLQRGFSPNGKEGDALPLLHIAAGNGHADIVSILVREGANINRDAGFAKVTPLILAVINNHIEVVRILLSNRANVCQAEWHNGNTPLHFASQLGHTDIVKLLLDCGADPNRTNTIGDLPAHLTVNEEIKKLLKEAENNITLLPDEVEWELLSIIRKGVTWRASSLREGEIRLRIEGLETEWGVTINQSAWVTITSRRQRNSNDKPTIFLNATADFGNHAVTKFLVAAIKKAEWK